MAYQRTEHENKYDRQLRLWGAHGQQLLETSHICVIGSNAVASETLKNLVLPNIGEFTLIDQATVTEADVHNNFFVTPEDINRPRAQVVTKYLLEMNPEVKGHAVVQNVFDIIKHDISFFSKFQCVIVTQPTHLPAIRTLASYCYKHQIPFVMITSIGFVGKLRLQLSEHTIIESHPTNDRYDLYIHPQQLQYFPALQSYINSFQLDRSAMDGEEHAHVPYVVILVQEAKKWMEQVTNKPCFVAM